ncbi:DUF732 domain-containing protein [Mycolicibacterium sp. XJ870]
MTARTMIAPVIAGVAAAMLTAAPAHADPIDDSFLAALNSGGVTYNDPGAAVALGQQVCPMLVEPGKSFASVASRLRGDNGISPDMAAFFTGIAISMYCPQMISSINNGTLLSMLATPGLNLLRP